MSPATSRARSIDQKLERRQAILNAAQTHLIDVGFEAFTMASLARCAGLAKGTLYLYFHTREEVLLNLCERRIDQWASNLEETLHINMEDATFCEAFITTSQEDPLLLPLMLRLSAIIEQNVSLDALITTKRAMRNRIGQLAHPVAKALDMSRDQANEAIRALAPLLLGTAQSDQGPQIERESLPEDIREFVDSFDGQNIFLTNAARIIRCIRAGN